MAECEWCGHAHPRAALCAKRPTWNRRGFLALLGAAAVGAVADPLHCLTPAAIHVRFDLDQMTFRRYVLLSEELIRDSAVNVEAYVRGALLEHIQRAEADLERTLIYGGPLAPRPRGFLSS